MESRKNDDIQVRLFGTPTEFGDLRHRELMAEHELVTSGPASAMASRVQRHLNLFRDARPKRVHVVQSRDFNAWTLPGDHIYVSTPFFERGLTEAGLAFIVGHEMGHHDLGHLELGERWVASMSSLIPERATRLLGLVAQPFLHSRGDEHEADLYGALLAVEAGHALEDVLSVLDLLERLVLERGRLEDLYDDSEDGGWVVKAASLFKSSGAQSSWKTHPSLFRRRDVLTRRLR